MKLGNAAWQKVGIETPKDLCRFFPDDNIVINLTEAKDEPFGYLVWGVFYIEGDNGRVKVRLPGNDTWRAQAYRFEQEELVWVSDEDEIRYRPFDFSKLDELLIEKIDSKRKQLSANRPPDPIS